MTTPTLQAAGGVLQAILPRIRHAPHRLRAILDGEPAPLIAFSVARRVLAANAAGESFFGYGRRELDAQSVDLLLPSRVRHATPPVQAPTTEPVALTLPALRKDGTEVEAEWTFACVGGPDGPLFLLSVHDATAEHARFGQRERDLGRRFRTVYENALDGIVLLDANPAACRILERSREQLVGVESAQFMAAADRDSATARADSLRASGRMTGERAMVLPDGTVRRAEFGAVANVSPGLHLVVFRDIEDRKRAEDARQFFDEAWQVLVSSLELDETLASLAHLAVPRLADWAGVELLEEDGSFRRVALVHVDPTKVDLVGELRRRQHPHIDDRTGVGAVVRTGRPELVEVMTDDRLKSAVEDEDLLATVRALGIVSAMTVPLSASGTIIGAISLVSAESRRRFGKEDLAVAMQLARRASYPIENAVRMRDFAHATEYLQRRTQAQLDASEVRFRQSESASEELARLSRAKDEFVATMSHELRTPLHAISGWASMLRKGPCDEATLDEGLAAIERNAHAQTRLVSDLLDASRIASGKLAMALRRSEVLPIVTAAADVVKPTADAADVRPVLDVHAQGGSVEATSEGLGLGATFTVTLPDHGAAVTGPHGPEGAAVAGERSKAPPLASPSVLAGIHVLAVEDDLDSVRMTRVMLEKAGARVTSASSALEALEALSQGARYDVVVSDVAMPEMDGRTLLQLLRSRRKGLRLPAIALTGYASAGDAQRSKGAGFQAHLAKPVDEARLVATVAEWVNR